jgi:hypothetical protein
MFSRKNGAIVHFGRFLAFPTNIGLGCKGLPWTNISLLRKFVNFNHKISPGCKKDLLVSRQDPIKIDSPGMLWSNPNGASALPDNQGPML